MAARHTPPGPVGRAQRDADPSGWSTQIWASIRRTPSTNRTRPAVRHRAADAGISAGSSTSTSTSAVDAPSSVQAGAVGRVPRSTLNLTGAPGSPTRCARPGSPRTAPAPLGQRRHRVISPTIRSPEAARFSRVLATISRLASSSTNPSSRKIDSSRGRPARPGRTGPTAPARHWPGQRLDRAAGVGVGVVRTTRNSPPAWVRFFDRRTARPGSPTRRRQARPARSRERSAAAHRSVLATVGTLGGVPSAAMLAASAPFGESLPAAAGPLRARRPRRAAPTRPGPSRPPRSPRRRRARPGRRRCSRRRPAGSARRPERRRRRRPTRPARASAGLRPGQGGPGGRRASSGSAGRAVTAE